MLSASLHIEFTAVAHLLEGQFLCTTDNRVKFVILLDGTLWLILLNKEGKIVILWKHELKKQHQADTFQTVNYVTLEDYVQSTIIIYVRESDNYKKKE
jgi:hypothetical protein